MEKVLLTEDELYKVILEILSSEKFFYSEELGELLVFTNPTATLKLYLEYLEESKVNLYIKEGYISESQIDEDLKAQFFSTEDQEELEEIENKLRAYKILLKKRVKNSPQAKSDQEKIKELEFNKDTLLAKKVQLNSYTAEHKAKEDKYLELFTNCVLTPNRQKRWASTEDFLNNIDNLSNLYSLLNNYLEFYFGYTVNKIRQIARSNLWINYYITSMKTGSPLFSNKPEDYSWNQLHLMSWSTFYMDIREMLYTDRPSEEMINDDERLDKYLEEYSRKFKAERALEKGSALNSNSDKDQHVIVTAESEDYIKFHRANVYSDPSVLSNQVGDNSASYDESAELKKRKRIRAGIQ
jgi:hypothetical protein